MRIVYAVLCLILVGCGAAPIEPVGRRQLTRTPAEGAARVAVNTPEPEAPTEQKDVERSTEFPFGLIAPSTVLAPPTNATHTTSGLAYEVLQEGTGEQPTENDWATVHYVGWKTSGEHVDDSSQRGPTRFRLKGVIPGWTEALQGMKEGGELRVWIPAELAYKNAPGKPEGMLVFDIYLIKVERAEAPPEAPVDVMAAPASASVTASGLKSVVLQPGTGTEHPNETSKVTVHYSGWTTDGNMFDSSVTRGKPSTFPLNRVIPGWTEGLQLMVEGEKRRFWIPDTLAYKGKRGAPQGTLVFDVELIKFEK